MSRAFVKEDVDVPERAGRRRSASGLPPGAINYMTAAGAARLHEEATRLRSQGDPDSAAEIERILASATIAEPQNQPDLVTFGSTVTVEDEHGEHRTYHVVGVDEVSLEDGAVSWISPFGRALLGAKLGARISLDDGGSRVTIRKIAR